MGASAVFGNEIFDQWLNQKSLEILNKVEKEKISNEDMLILSLKAQVNHFHHMDIEFRQEFKSIGKNFEDVSKRFEQVDKRFDHLSKVLMWAFGILGTIHLGMLAKLYS
jgi:hypothetical protein